MTKKLGRPLIGKEKKVSYNVYLEPKKKARIVKNYGSLTLAIETLDIKLNQDFKNKNK